MRGGNTGRKGETDFRKKPNITYWSWKGDLVNSVWAHRSGVKKLYVLLMASNVALTKLPMQRVQPREEV